MTTRQVSAIDGAQHFVRETHEGKLSYYDECAYFPPNYELPDHSLKPIRQIEVTTPLGKVIWNVE